MTRTQLLQLLLEATHLISDPDNEIAAEDEAADLTCRLLAAAEHLDSEVRLA